MCGFLVVWKKKSNSPFLDMEKLSDLMEHRGPDEKGVYYREPVSMGFRRLQIIDLEEGKQPILNEDKSICLVFNGEIYNYRELRRELLNKGHKFKSECDSEVILHLYEEEGEECIKRLRGMFAFCLYDRHKEIIFGGRDRFGIKPLYYLDLQDHFALASEAKVLLHIPGYEREVNSGALPHYLTFQYVPAPQTMFKGIYKVPPAYKLTYDGSILNLKRYWRARFLPQKRPMDDMATELVNLMKETVELHTRSDKSWGAFLSGGVDSSIIVALLRELKKVSTFSVGYADADYSELGEAAENAKVLETDHHEYVIDSDEFWNHLPDLVWHLDDPVADPSAISLYFVARLARQKVSVVLSGEGADEVFGGYGIYREPQSLRPVSSLPQPLRFAAGAGSRLLPGAIPGKNYLQRGATPLRDRFVGNARIFNELEKEQILKQKQYMPPAAITDALYDVSERFGYDEVTTMQHIDIHTWMEGDILLKADKMTMANSLELRVPFLDHHLFEFAATIPTAYKIHQNMTKYILREAFRDYLPEVVINRPKKGFPVPTRKWLRGPLRGKMKEALANPLLDSYFHRSFIQSLVEDYLEGRADHSRKLWVLLIFSIWLDKFKVSAGKE